jgi:hypothetical protein
MDAKEQRERARRRMPRRTWLHVAGLFAVLVLCFGFAAWAIMEEPPESSVLVVAVPLAAGQMIGEADVAEVSVAAGEVAALGLVPVGEVAAVVGNVAAVPLQAGTLLRADMIGSPLVPQTGFAKVTLAIADGRWPSDVQAGQRVSLMGASETDATGVWQSSGTVLAVERPESGGALVTVELPEAAMTGLVAVEAASLLMAATAQERSAAVTVPETGGGN